MIRKFAAFVAIFLLLVTCGACRAVPQMKNGEADNSCNVCHTVAGREIPAGHPDVEDPEEELCARIKIIFNDVQSGEYLAAFHAKQDVSCGNCHGQGLPEMDMEMDTETCLACHESYEALAELTKNERVAEQNPHKSHLGELDCCVCHHAHTRSRSYCLQCHSDFNMPMPGRK